MKTVYSITLGLLLALNSNAQIFRKAKGGGTDVSISKKGEVFVVGTSKQIFKYDFKIEDFKLHSVANRKAKVIAAAQEKFTYLLTTDGLMHITYANNDKRIGPIGSLSLKDIYVGKNNALWGIDNRGAVKKYSSNWQSFSIAGSDNKKVCANNAGRVFTIKNNNTIYEYYNGKVQKLPGAATDISYDHAQQKLYVLGTSKRIFVWDAGRKNWDLVRNTRNDFRSIAVHSGKLWGTTTKNEIYTTASIKNNSTDSKNYGGLYRVTVLHIYSNTWSGNTITDYQAEIFGTIGIRAYGVGNSGKVEIKALENKAPRVWSASRNSPRSMQEYNKENYSLALPYKYARRYEIDKIREFKIQGELANNKLSFNIQMNLRKKGLVDEVFPWKSKTLEVKDIKLGKEYAIESVSPKEEKFYPRRLAVVFKVDKY